MTITVVTLGSTALTNFVINIDKPKPQKIAEHRIPGRSTNVFQVLSTNSKDITLTGRLFGSNRDTTRSTLEGYQGTTQTYNDGEDNFTVLVESVVFPRSGTTPGYLPFTIRLKEYSQGS